jgi:protein-L-isoaspartate(D-aspartate) O-methyltransferase
MPLSASDEALARFLVALRSAGIRNPALIEALEAFPRRLFLPPALREEAHAPYPLPLAAGAEATEPMTVARMLDAAAISPGQRVIEVGAGSGWQTALISRHTRRLVTIERRRSLAEAAARIFDRLGVRGVDIRHEDALDPGEALEPADVVIVNGTPPGTPDAVPQALRRLLRPGGRMVLPLGPLDGGQRLFVLEGDAEPRPIAPSRYPPLQIGRSEAL